MSCASFPTPGPRECFFLSSFSTAARSLALNAFQSIFFSADDASVLPASCDGDVVADAVESGARASSWKDCSLEIGMMR